MKNNNKGIHPVWFFILLSFVTILLSSILSIFNIQGNEMTISLANYKTSTSVVAVESLLSLEGLKFIFGEAINNFLKFMPLGTLIVGLMGIGVAIKTGFLKSIFKKIADVVPRKTAFFIFSLLCIIMGFNSDLAYIVMIPIASIMFTEYKRSQMVGMTMAFTSVAAGANINLFITSIDYSLIELASPAVKMIDSDYSYGYSGNIYFIVVASILLALLLSYMTDIICRTKPVRIGDEELKVRERADKRGLRNSFIAFSILLIIFIYAIIPGLPLSGMLLDNSQKLYVNKLFGANSPFVNGILYIVSLTFAICGIIYGVSTRQIKDDKDAVKYLSNSLNGLGEMLILIFVASQFVAMFKYTNIGEVVTSLLYEFIKNNEFSFIVLILISFVSVVLSGLTVTSLSTKWSLFVPGIIPLFMKSNITPEFAGAIFRLAASLPNIITPLLPYFVVFVGFIGLYSKDDFNVKKCYKLLFPYFLAITILWLFIIIGWYVLKTPIGPNIYPTI